MTKVKLAGATVNQIPLDWDNNAGNILAAIAEARNQKVDLLCFPELCLTGYGCEDVFLTDWLSKRAWSELLKILPSCKNIIVCIGIPLRIEGKTYNGVCVVHEEKILGITLKQNLAKEGSAQAPRACCMRPPSQAMPVGESAASPSAVNALAPVLRSISD